MCGIAGIIDHTLHPDVIDSQIDEMLIAIAHRGPDSHGKYQSGHLALGHNRLSIIDLSSEAGQPMILDNYVIVFNGEIYNYIELKTELVGLGYKFKTHSDTEVVIVSFMQWGKDCVSRFIGMWAFALMDCRKREVFLSRDRFGIKPLYYIFESNKLYFASEIKALKKVPLFNSELNLTQISRGLQLGWICYQDETYFSGIKALPAAHNMIIQYNESGINKFHVSSYWDISSGCYSSLKPDEKVERFRAMFQESIRLHMRSDVPVATCLSGGLDSSAIVSMVQHLHPNTSYKSFSIYYNESGDVDERPFINEVIKKYPAIEPFYKSPTSEEVAEEFHSALYHADVPATGSSFISQYFLMKLIAENNIKVVLDGQGSDEYLAGYMHTHYRIIASKLLHGNLIKAGSLTYDLGKRLSLDSTRMFAHFMKSVLSALMSENALYRLEYKKYYPFLLNSPQQKDPFSLQKVPGSRTDQFLYHLIFNTSLPSLLHYEDRNSMAFSIESRVPFLDHRLVEFAFTLDDHDKIYKNETKKILRSALKGILPDSIERRQDKKGFVTPGEQKWLKGPLCFLLDFDPKFLEFLDQRKLNSIIRQYRSGDPRYASLVWRIAVLNYWLKHFAQ